VIRGTTAAVVGRVEEDRRSSSANLSYFVSPSGLIKPAMSIDIL
jgi:hypothetical protein